MLRADIGVHGKLGQPFKMVYIGVSIRRGPHTRHFIAVLYIDVHFLHAFAEIPQLNVC